MKPGINSHTTVRAALAGAACLLIVVGNGCGARVSEEDKAEALQVIRDLKRLLDRRDYKAAMRCFSAPSQKRIRNIGGGPTPLEGFFITLKPILKRPSRTVISRGKVWIYYEARSGFESIVAISKAEQQGWVITMVKDEEWRI